MLDSCMEYLHRGECNWVCSWHSSLPSNVTLGVSLAKDQNLLCIKIELDDQEKRQKLKFSLSYLSYFSQAQPHFSSSTLLLLLPHLSLERCRVIWSVHKSFSMLLLLPHTFPLLQCNQIPWAVITQNEPAPAWTAAFSREHSPEALCGLPYGYLLFCIVLSMGCRGICSGTLNTSSPSPHITMRK